MSSTLPRQITEPARTIDVIHETDVLVVGSGPGGLGAALGAARAGARTTLVERHGCFGGNITAVGVETFAWYRRKETVDSVGVGAEIEARARAAGATTDESQSTSQALEGLRTLVVEDQAPSEPIPESSGSTAGGAARSSRLSEASSRMFGRRQSS